MKVNINVEEAKAIGVLVGAATVGGILGSGIYTVGKKINAKIHKAAFTRKIKKQDVKPEEVKTAE